MLRSIVRRLIDAMVGLGPALVRVVRRIEDRPFEIPRLDASADSLWPPVPEEHPAHWRFPHGWADGQDTRATLDHPRRRILR